MYVYKENKREGNLPLLMLSATACTWRALIAVMDLVMLLWVEIL